MHIFIDESGSFSGLDRDKPAISTLGALILPTHVLPRLVKRYSRIRPKLPTRKGEVKGSLLNESQFIEVIDLLRKNGAIFCASMIDMAEHKLTDVERHRSEGIAALSRNLSNGHTPELRKNIAQLQDRMGLFSPQLYAQLMVTFDLLHRVMEEMIAYHSQRNPKELESFHWIVDAKQSDHISDWEDWWSNTLVVWLQAMSLKRPGLLLKFGDYRHFQRFFHQDVPDYLSEHVKKDDPKRPAGVDLQLLFREHFAFSSDPLPGLELVDIVTNGLRRALIGNLQEAAWLRIRDLMINRQEGCIRPVSLFFEDRQSSKPYSEVLYKLRSGNRSMLTNANQTR